MTPDSAFPGVSYWKQVSVVILLRLFSLTLLTSLLSKLAWYNAAACTACKYTSQAWPRSSSRHCSQGMHAACRTLLVSCDIPRCHAVFCYHRPGLDSTGSRLGEQESSANAGGPFFFFKPSHFHTTRLSAAYPSVTHGTG